MAAVEFRHVDKIYPDGTQAVSDLSLDIHSGEFMVLVGPSGCGKSTLLRMLAGLEDITQGGILIDGKKVNGLPPQRRNVAMVFQNYALYPHMTVRGNMEFPLRMMKLGREERNRRIARAAEVLGLTPLLGQRPRNLSGGQRQRVAMGRAIVRNPDVFLMDEPLSNLDARLRVQIRSEIASLQRQLACTTVYVTHDQVEAMTLGDRVAVIERGRVQQVAEPQDLYDHPANTFVAGFIGNPGMNIIRSVLRRTPQGALTVEIGSQHLALPTGLPGIERFCGREILVGLRPESFSLDGHASQGACLDVTVQAIEPLGSETIVHFTIRGVQTIGTPTAGAPDTLAARIPAPIEKVQPDTPLRLGVDCNRLHLFSPDGQSIGPA